MPWQETEPVEQRLRFIAAMKAGGETVSELCRRFGVSRKTAYKWIERYEAEGIGGLTERSSRPKTSPARTSIGVEEALLRLKEEKPRWGPKKLVVLLRRRFPELL